MPPQNPPVNPMPFMPQPTATSQPTVNIPPIIPPPPKKAFSKIIIYIAAGILLLVLGFFLVRMFTGTAATSSEITWWGLWEDENVVSSLIAEYEATNPKVKIKYIKQSPIDYRERLTNSLAKGQGPDIF